MLRLQAQKSFSAINWLVFTSVFCTLIYSDTKRQRFTSNKFNHITYVSYKIGDGKYKSM